MPYRNSLNRLQNELRETNNGLCLFLQTDTNIYSFRSELTEEQQIDILNPISTYLNEKEYDQYDSLERRANTVYYIIDGMEEFHAFNNIIELNNQIINNDVAIATIRTIDNEKVKIIIFKKGNFIFLYRYNTSKLFKQGWKARFNSEEAVVEKENDSILVLSKTIPDIILDTRENCSFVLNVTQAEYILEIEELFKGTMNNVEINLKRFNLMREDTIIDFMTEVSAKNTHMRKLHKIQTTQSYQYFYNNIGRVPEVLRQYNLNVNFDEVNGQIIFDEDTDVGDVLHLFADDYVRRYISERDDVIK